MSIQVQDEEIPHAIRESHNVVTLVSAELITPQLLRQITVGQAFSPAVSFLCDTDSNIVGATFSSIDRESWWSMDGNADVGYVGFADGRRGEVTWEKWKIGDSLMPATLVGEFLFETALSSESLVVEMRVGWDSRELEFNTLAARELLEQFKSSCPLL